MDLIVGETGSAALYDPGSGTFSPTGHAVIWGRNSAILLTNGKVLFTGAMGDYGEDIHTELYDPVTGVFTPTGNMTTPRADHSATLLADGTVFLAGSQRGGSDGGRAFASPELYDPVTGTFSATGDMITTRFGQAAPLLPDGTVLIAGGSAKASGTLSPVCFEARSGVAFSCSKPGRDPPRGNSFAWTGAPCRRGGSDEGWCSSHVDHFFVVLLEGTLTPATRTCMLFVRNPIF